MLEHDIDIYRRIQLTRGKPESYQLWVEKITEDDRMLLVRNTRPHVEGLKWHQVTKGVWSGRLSQDESEINSDNRKPSPKTHTE